MKHFWQKEKTDELREGMTVTAWSLVQWRGSLRAHAGSRLRNRRPNTYFLVFYHFQLCGPHRVSGSCDYLQPLEYSRAQTVPPIASLWKKQPHVPQRASYHKHPDILSTCSLQISHLSSAALLTFYKASGDSDPVFS